MAALASAQAIAADRTPKDIQSALSQKGFNPGAVDGLWGKKSARALTEFQRSHGLPATGKIDDATLSALFPEYPGLENRGDDSSDGQQVVNDPAPEAISQPVEETRGDQKADRIPADPVPASGASESLKTEVEPTTALTVESDTTPKTVTPASTAETGSSGLPRQPGESGGQPFTLYLVGSIILAGIFLARRKSKARSKPAWSPPPADLADAEAFQAKSPIVARGSRRRGGEAVVSDTPQLPGTPIPPSADVLTVDFGRKRADARARPDVTSDNDLLTTIEERPAAVDDNPTSLKEHAATVRQWVIENAEASRKRYDEAHRGHIEGRAEPAKAHVSSPGWIERGSEVTVAGVRISGGLVYVGTTLDKQGRRNDVENCLINPGLRVAQWGDRDGRTMGYWPSYSSMTPEARRSYLDWLAGDRADPTTYIGYVFLYFYGLERRLMLDGNARDADLVALEVRRLLEVYGANHSFNRYATELLTAVELKSGEPSAQFLARVEPNGYEVPTAIRIALGVRVRDDRVIEPELLYRFAVTHPETRARTPARRAPELMRQLFAQRMLDEYPAGFRYKAARAKPLRKHYKACSGTFEVDIDILGGNIPDIAHHAQPIGVARRFFDACSDALDEYSRVLGRLPGLTPNILAVSKLPKTLRLQQANLLEGRPLDRLLHMSRDADVATVSDIARLAGTDVAANLSKPKLREVSQLLAAFGLGVTFDPAFATRTLSASDPAMVFPIDLETSSEPTDSFRSVQLAVMLGLVVGHADGHFDDRERDTLVQRIASEPSLTGDERSRLRSELRVNEVHPDRLDEWMKRLKDISPDSRMAVANELVSVASADGNLHAAEVRKLELVFKRMGLGNQVLYDRLHAGSDVRNAAADEPAQVTPDSPKGDRPPTRIDLSKLRSIRSETSVTANVLADIFAEEEQGFPEPIVVESDTAISEVGTYEGLEQRYGALLNELCLRSSWAVSDFEHLARDAGLMPGAAREAINDWAMDRFDELLIEGDDPVEIAIHLLPPTVTNVAADKMEARQA